ncbi:MAG: hypothetical protein ACM3NV_03235, partial [Syntrophothermus sp.]
MNNVVTTPAGLVAAAANAALPLLPSSSPLTAGEAIATAAGAAAAGQAVRARFAGAAQGEIAIVVGQDLVNALSDTPMGALDLSQAIRPALEAAAATLGPVVVDPGEIAKPVDAIAAVLGAGGLM